MKTYLKNIYFALIYLMIPFAAIAQIRDWPDDEIEGFKVNYTEANVPSYNLPDILTLSNGKKVDDPQVDAKETGEAQ